MLWDYKGVNMATAISFTSESGDHYLDLFENGETIEEIVSNLKENYGSEFQYLYVQNCESSNYDTSEVEGKITEEIEASYEGDDEE